MEQTLIDELYAKKIGEKPVEVETNYVVRDTLRELDQMKADERASRRNLTPRDSRGELIAFSLETIHIGEYAENL